MNLQELQDRVKTKTKEIEWYKKAYLSLIAYYYIQSFDDINSLNPNSEGLEQEFYEMLVKGEMPDDDMFLRVGDDFLDVFLHSCLFVMGTILGVMDLTKKMDEENSKLVSFLLQNTEDKTFLTRSAFASLSLAMESAPDSQMLMTMFPKSNSDELKERQIVTITSLYGIAVQKAISKTCEGSVSVTE